MSEPLKESSSTITKSPNNSKSKSNVPSFYKNTISEENTQLDELRPSTEINGPFNITQLLLLVALLRLIYYQYEKDKLDLMGEQSQCVMNSSISFLIPLAQRAGQLLVFQFIQKIRRMKLIPFSFQFLVYIVFQFSLFFIGREHELQNGIISRLISSGQQLVFGLKLHSFFATNNATQKEEGEYRDVSIYQYYKQFLLIPLVVYAHEYPQKPFNLYRFFKNLFRFLLIQSIVLIVFKKFLHDRINNDSRPFQILQVELMIPMFMIWLMSFYSFFHCYLNILSEITQIGSRKFYLDWWNSPDLDVFWRKWNIPIHDFCVRHLQMEPVKIFGMNKFVAMMFTFIISALLHELLMQMTFLQVDQMMFSGMLLQIPGIILSVKLNKMGQSKLGNQIVWVSLICGFPMLILQQQHGWVQMAGGKGKSDFFCHNERDILGTILNSI